MLLLWPLLALAMEPAPATDVAWLPVVGPWASVRLTEDADTDDPRLAALLEPGRQVGGRHRELLRALRGDDATIPDPTSVWRVPTAALGPLLDHPDVEAIWGHPAPAPPPLEPGDLPPETPDFTEDQKWRLLGVEGGWWWPGGRGTGIRVADVEYAFDPAHEDLANVPVDVLGGEPVPAWSYHGNAVLSLVGARDDGFGTTGAAPDSSVLVVHPVDGEVHDTASAILDALAELGPGDVILVEQVADTALGFAPPSADPAVFDAIALATAAGVVVIEPTGNDGLDLDDPSFEGHFARDHGGILVASADPDTRLWDGRSGFGSRVDLHGWGRRIHAATDATFEPDLFLPEDGDTRQAYTRSFGGTSGAAAQVAGAVAQAQGVALALHQEPVPPRRIRDWMRATGSAQDALDAAEHPIGATVDLERMLRVFLQP